MCTVLSQKLQIQKEQYSGQFCETDIHAVRLRSLNT